MYGGLHGVPEGDYGREPSYEGERFRTGDHILEAVPSRIDGESLYWECADCEKRFKTSLWFFNKPCHE